MHVDYPEVRVSNTIPTHKFPCKGYKHEIGWYYNRIGFSFLVITILQRESCYVF